MARVYVETAATLIDPILAQSLVTQISSKPTDICVNLVLVKPSAMQTFVEAATSNSIASLTLVNQSSLLILQDIRRVYKWIKHIQYAPIFEPF